MIFKRNGYLDDFKTFLVFSSYLFECVELSITALRNSNIEFLAHRSNTTYKKMLFTSDHIIRKISSMIKFWHRARNRQKICKHNNSKVLYEAHCHFEFSLYSMLSNFIIFYFSIKPEYLCCKRLNLCYHRSGSIPRSHKSCTSCQQNGTNLKLHCVLNVGRIPNNP